MSSKQSEQKGFKLLSRTPTAEPSSADEVTEVTVCEFCFGTGVEVVPDRGARPCKCRTAPSKQKVLKGARIPDRYSGCSLQNYKTLSPSQCEAFEFAWELATKYPAVNRGLLFMGPVGVGKTHLAVGVLRAIIANGFPGLFYEFGSLLKQIQDSYNPISQTSEMRVLAPVYQAEVLVLDELGASVPTDWVRDTMYQIINHRYNQRKLTIFTTNFSDERPLAEENSNVRRTDKRVQPITSYTLDERIGVPLRSRLYEMCLTVQIKGDDFRKIKG